MRIISGAAKGVRLVSPSKSQKKHQEIRPTADRSREALFSILQPYLHDTLLLDLFAGTGAIGLEALSRGAASAVFIEKNIVALEILQKNIINCLQYFPPEAKIRTMQLTLPTPLPHQLLHDMDDNFCGFDLIFADPPYDTGLSKEISEYIADEKLLVENGTLIVEERHTTPLPEHIASLHLQSRRVYGENAFHFYQEKR